MRPRAEQQRWRAWAHGCATRGLCSASAMPAASSATGLCSATGDKSLIGLSSLGGMPRSAERPRSAAIGGQATRERGREAGLIAGSRARLRDAHAEEASLPHGGRRGAPTTRRCAAAARLRDVPRPRLENPICAPAWLGLMRSPWGVPVQVAAGARGGGRKVQRAEYRRNTQPRIIYKGPSWSSKRRDASAERGRVKVTGSYHADICREYSSLM
jgi:hypothetical protein